MSVIGLDIGSSNIKAVSLETSGKRYFLDKYVIVPSNGFDKRIFDGSIDDAVVAKELREFISSNNFGSNKVVATLPENKVFSQIRLLPKLPDKDFKKAVEWEAEQFLLGSIEDYYIKELLIDENQKKSMIKSAMPTLTANPLTSDSTGLTKVFIIASEKKVINRYLSVLNKANLDVMGMVPTSISLVKGLVAGNDLSSVTVILNIGFNNTELYLSVDNNVQFVRIINVGILSMAKIVSQELDVSLSQANEYVFTYGLKKDELNGKIFQIISPIIDIIRSEFVKSKKYIESRDVFKDASNSNVVTKVIVSGGGTLIPSILEYLPGVLGENVEYANPWGNVDISSVMSQQDLIKLGPILAVAVGAAMKGL